MSNVAAISPSQNSPRPMWHVFAALAAAILASIAAGVVQQQSPFSALGSSTFLSNVLIGSVGMMLILPAINVAIASIWQSKRNSRARRNIYFGWGAVVAVLQMGILASGLSPTKNAPLAPSISANEQASATVNSAWIYTHDTNAMTGVVTHVASVADGRDKLQRIATSAGDSRVVLNAAWRDFCKDLKDCVVLVRFDSGEPQRYRIEFQIGQLILPTIENSDRFLTGLASAERVRISEDPYPEGGRFFEFNVSGFDDGKFEQNTK